MPQRVYDFDSITDRRSTYASKWDIGENELPMWIADMDFQLAPEIREALQRRLDNGIFGYTDIPDKTCSDSARYKALGNGMAQPCPDFIIKRITECVKK